MRIQGIDEIDNMILDVIKDDARLGFTEIGSKVGLSRVSVRNRMENMEKNGIIKGYHTMIDPTAVPGGTKFFVNIETAPDAYEGVVEMLAYDQRIRQIYSATGACKIHAHGFAPCSEDVAYFTRHLFSKTKGIKKLEWDIVASTLHDIDGGVDYVVRKNSGYQYLEGRQQGEQTADQISSERSTIQE